MLIESRVTAALEAVRRLQSLVQEAPNASSKDIIKSRELLEEFENNFYSLFNLKQVNLEPKVIDTSSNKEVISQISSIAYESNRIFNIVKQLPVCKNKNITFIRRHDENRLAKNKFTNRLCHIRAELGNDQELFYLIQYEDSSYSMVTEENLSII